MAHKIFPGLKKAFFLSVLFLFPVVSCHAEETFFRDGMLMLGDGDFTGAVEAFKKAAVEAPGDAYVLYYLGTAYYGAELYSEALDAFVKSSDFVPPPEGIHLGIGKTYYKLERYEDALAELKKAEYASPDDSAPPFFTGLVYFEQGLYEKSAAAFARAAWKNDERKATALKWEGESLRRAGYPDLAEKRLAEADEIPQENRILTGGIASVPKKTKPWMTGFTFGIEYDDNVVLFPDSPQPHVEISDKGDWRAIFGLNCRYSGKAGPGDMRIYYRFFQSVHNRLSDYDLQGHTAGMTFLLSGCSLKPEIKGELSYYSAGGDDYLFSCGVTPSVLLFSNHGGTGRIYAGYERNDFLFRIYDPANDRDGDAYTAGTDFVFHASGGVKIKTDFRYTGIFSEGDNWDYSGPSVNCSLEIPLAKNALNLNLAGKYRYMGFKNDDSYFGKVREDERWTLSAGAVWEAKKNVNVYVYHAYVYNKSNISAYEYSRNISSMLLGLRF